VLDQSRRAKAAFSPRSQRPGSRGALSWELHTATSLARRLRDQRPSTDAKAPLQPVYDRFTEGFDTADLKAVRALLLALQE
jgi:predicted ATPase